MTLELLVTFHLRVVAVEGSHQWAELHRPVQVVAVDTRWAGLRKEAGQELGGRKPAQQSSVLCFYH